MTNCKEKPLVLKKKKKITCRNDGIVLHFGKNNNLQHHLPASTTLKVPLLGLFW